MLRNFDITVSHEGSYDIMYLYFRRYYSFPRKEAEMLFAQLLPSKELEDKL